MEGVRGRNRKEQFDDGGLEFMLAFARPWRSFRGIGVRGLRGEKYGILVSVWN